MIGVYEDSIRRLLFHKINRNFIKIFFSQKRPPKNRTQIDPRSITWRDIKIFCKLLIKHFFYSEVFTKFRRF